MGERDGLVIAVALAWRRAGRRSILKSRKSAVDVEIGDHSRHTRLTAASASEAVISGRARWTARTASSVWPR